MRSSSVLSKLSKLVWVLLWAPALAIPIFLPAVALRVFFRRIVLGCVLLRASDCGPVIWSCYLVFSIFASLCCSTLGLNSLLLTFAAANCLSVYVVNCAGASAAKAPGSGVLNGGIFWTVHKSLLWLVGVVACG